MDDKLDKSKSPTKNKATHKTKRLFKVSLHRILLPVLEQIYIPKSIHIKEYNNLKDQVQNGQCYINMTRVNTNTLCHNIRQYLASQDNTERRKYKTLKNPKSNCSSQHTGSWTQTMQISTSTYDRQLRPTNKTLQENAKQSHFSNSPMSLQGQITYKTQMSISL